MTNNVLSVDDSGNVILKNADAEIFNPARQLVSDARNILTPTGLWGTISQQHSNVPIIATVGDMHPTSVCNLGTGCPGGYTCVKRSGTGRCYVLEWNRPH